jgi:hypothetical protein
MSVRLVDRIDVREAPDGTRRQFSLSIARLGDGSLLTVPVHVLAGTGAGPCLAVVAGVHGDEAEGIAALFELSREMQLTEMKGRLVLVLIANPPAFAAHQRRSPVDGIDLNRVFPGSPSGSLSERLAHRLFLLVKENAQFLFTLHSWYATGDALPHVEISGKELPTREATFRAAVASGFSHVRLADWHPGLFPSAANTVGIPSMEAEIGGMGTSRTEYRKQYGDHIRALMRHLGMLSEPSAQPSRRPDAFVSQHVTAGTGGVLLTDAVLGSAARKGDLLGTIVDPQGGLLEELRSPFDGVLMARRTFLSVTPGDIVFTLFRPTPPPVTE